MTRADSPVLQLLAILALTVTALWLGWLSARQVLGKPRREREDGTPDAQPAAPEGDGTAVPRPDDGPGAPGRDSA